MSKDKNKGSFVVDLEDQKDHEKGTLPLEATNRKDAENEAQGIASEASEFTGDKVTESVREV